MKNLISVVASTIALSSSPVFADDGKKKIEEKPTTRSVQASSEIAQKTDIILSNNEQVMQEEWRKNTEKLASSILPGNPISYHQDYYKSIVLYRVNSDKKSGINTYAGGYDAPGGVQTIGVIFEIKVGK